PCRSVEVAHADVKQVPCAQGGRGLSPRAQALRMADFGLDPRRNHRSDLILYNRDLTELAVELIRPNVPAALGLDETCPDPNTRAQSPDAALDDVVRAEIQTDAARIRVLSLEHEARTARDDEQ